MKKTAGHVSTQEQQQAWDTHSNGSFPASDVPQQNQQVVDKLQGYQRRYGQEQAKCYDYIVHALCTGPNLEHLADGGSTTESERRDARVLQWFEQLHMTTDNRFAEKAGNRAACLGGLVVMFPEEDRIVKLSSFLEKEGITDVHRVTKLYLELQVLAEKFSRILAPHCGMVTSDGDDRASDRMKESVHNSVGLIAQKLLCVRNWSTTEHPHLLASEVENRLQIRPQQYDIFKLCRDQPNAIRQLNMGEGKTCVIVAMLIRYFTVCSRKGAKTIMRQEPYNHQ